MTGRLEIISDTQKEIHGIPQGGFVVIGRASSVDIPIKDTTVSRVHCKISEKEGRFFVEDQKSRHGTLLNKQRIERAYLNDGDIIRVGRSQIRFSLIAEPVDETAGAQRTIAVSPQEKHDALFIGVALSFPEKQATQEQLLECVRIRQDYPEIDLRAIILRKGYLPLATVERVETIVKTLLNREETTAASDALEDQDAGPQEKRAERIFARLAIARGNITRADLRVCTLLQQNHEREGLYFKLPEILEREGYLTAAQVEEIRTVMSKEGSQYHIEGYEFISLLDMGGMASIYKARQISMDRLVAIKILAEQFRHDRELNELFMSEARAVARLGHENIILGIDFGEVDGLSYFVMEYVDGPSLQEEIRSQGGRLAPDRALAITLQVARALEHAHSRSLIHRDIKPENVLLTREGVVKLCDLGLAQSPVLATERRLKRREYGTPAYMSPEQIRREANIDIRSDIYSLGITFYRMLFGKLPFRGTARETMTAHLTEPIVFPSEGVNRPRMELARLITQMTAKNPAERYQTPTALISALEQAGERLVQAQFERTAEVPLPTVEGNPRRLPTSRRTELIPLLKRGRRKGKG